MLHYTVYNGGHNILKLFDIQPGSFFSPQVKYDIIISNKNGIHKLSHELPNNLRFGNSENVRKIQNHLEL